MWVLVIKTCSFTLRRGGCHCSQQLSGCYKSMMVQSPTFYRREILLRYWPISSTTHWVSLTCGFYTRRWLCSRKLSCSWRGPVLRYAKPMLYCFRQWNLSSAGRKHHSSLSLPRRSWALDDQSLQQQFKGDVEKFYETSVSYIDKCMVPFPSRV